MDFMNGKYSNKSLPLIDVSRFVLFLPGVPLVNEFIGSETLPYIRRKPYAPTSLPFLLWLVILLLPLIASAQSDQHYTMFMYNKLLYNPAYTGSRDVTSVNADYRDQWNNIDGAPKTANISIDAPVGSYMKTFRKVAVGFSLTNETLGVENNTTFKAYYAYRIKFNQFILSLGLSGGGDLYSANYIKLHIYQPNDPNFAANVSNNFLPNFGAGAYCYDDKSYISLSAPNMLQDAYDKKNDNVNNNIARQTRGIYLGGGHVFTLNETFKLLPQILVRYASEDAYTLPVNCDFNVSAIFMDRFLLGATYRTDKSVEAIVHIQATERLNVGYAYDYVISALSGYTGGTHEIVLGYDIVKDNSKFLTPRFIKKF